MIWLAMITRFPNKLIVNSGQFMVPWVAVLAQDRLRWWRQWLRDIRWLPHYGLNRGRLQYCLGLLALATDMLLRMLEDIDEAEVASPPGDVDPGVNADANVDAADANVWNV